MQLKQQLLEWMQGSSACFEEMALEVFAYQFTNNPAYQRYCQALEKSPEQIKNWREIPAVPTDVFKLPDLALRCFPENEVTGHFLTSGTTQEIKGTHQYRDLELYRAAVLGGWCELNLPTIPASPWFFSQKAEHAPYSSLVRMFDILDQNGTWLIDAEGHMHTAHFTPQQPAAILGTSLALLRACEEMNPIALATGSWIFETGGSKGLRKSYTPEQVRARLSQHFGVPEARILNEYGMTELFSQFYKWGNQENHLGPSWTAVRVVDLATGKPAKTGEIGYLEIIDLANLETISAIRTQDLAVAVGDREFRLIGRDPGALARGCSRGVEDVLQSRSH